MRNKKDDDRLKLLVKFGNWGDVFWRCEDCKKYDGTNKKKKCKEYDKITIKMNQMDDIIACHNYTYKTLLKEWEGLCTP